MDDFLKTVIQRRFSSYHETAETVNSGILPARNVESGLAKIQAGRYADGALCSGFYHLSKESTLCISRQMMDSIER
jgi:hypothetical protein